MIDYKEMAYNIARKEAIKEVQAFKKYNQTIENEKVNMTIKSGNAQNFFVTFDLMEDGKRIKSMIAYGIINIYGTAIINYIEDIQENKEDKEMEKIYTAEIKLDSIQILLYNCESIQEAKQRADEEANEIQEILAVSYYYTGIESVDVE